MSKLLVGCTLNEEKINSIPEFIKSLLELEHREKKIVLYCSGKILADSLQKAEGIEVKKTQKLGHFEEERARDFNELKEIALREGFEYLLLADAQVALPKNAMQVLLEKNAKACTGVYFKPFVKKQENVLWKTYISNLGEFPEGADLKCRLLGFSEILPSGEKEAGFALFGCMLLHKSAFKEIEFRSDEKGALVELFFAKDCKEKEIKIIADSSIAGKYISGEADIIVV